MGDKIILNTDTRHTCRNFESIHSWAIQRKTDLNSIEMVKNGTLTIVD